MDMDKLIDLLHAMEQQLAGTTVTLDGESHSVEEICSHAIEYLDGADKGLFM